MIFELAFAGMMGFLGGLAGARFKRIYEERKPLKDIVKKIEKQESTEKIIFGKKTKNFRIAGKIRSIMDDSEIIEEMPEEKKKVSEEPNGELNIILKEDEKQRDNEARKGTHTK